MQDRITTDTQDPFKDRIDIRIFSCEYVSLEDMIFVPREECLEDFNVFDVRILCGYSPVQDHIVSDVMI